MICVGVVALDLNPRGVTEVDLFWFYVDNLLQLCYYIYYKDSSFCREIAVLLFGDKLVSHLFNY